MAAEPEPAPEPKPPPAARATPRPAPAPPPVVEDELVDEDDLAQAPTKPRKRRRKSRPANDDATHMSIRVDAELRNYFHIACRLRNENASDVLRDYMRRYVDRHMKLPTD